MGRALRHRRGPGPGQRSSSPPSWPSTSPSPLRTCSARPVPSTGTGPLAVVGRDTRISGQFLEAAVVAGLASAGVDVLLLGVLPTPGVAYLTGALGADLGVMLSACHNPMPDNGIKFLARGGVKLDDAIEDAIEKRLREPWERPTGGAVGRVTTYDAAVDDYAAHLVSHRRPTRSTGLKVVLDCAARRRLRGRPARAARRRRRGGRDLRRARRPEHQRRLRLHPPRRRCSAPCSSTAPTSASRSTATPTAAWPSTHDGNVVDGDQILAILALAMRDAGTPQGRHRRRHGDEQPRLRAGDARRRASACGRPRSATATCSRR